MPKPQIFVVEIISTSNGKMKIYFIQILVPQYDLVRNFNECLCRTFNFLGQPQLLRDLDKQDFPVSKNY